jgi:DNA-binding NarL/FixJ family response regulator
MTAALGILAVFETQRSWAATAGGAMTGSGLEAVDELVPTPFQLRILRQKAGGKTDKAAARVLGVGERTIRRQIESLIGSLALGNRAALFVEVGRRGWLDLEVDDDPTDEIDVELSADERLAIMSA